MNVIRQKEEWFKKSLINLPAGASRWCWNVCFSLRTFLVQLLFILRKKSYEKRKNRNEIFFVKKAIKKLFRFQSRKKLFAQLFQQAKKGFIGYQINFQFQLPLSCRRKLINFQFFPFQIYFTFPLSPLCFATHCRYQSICFQISFIMFPNIWRQMGKKSIEACECWRFKLKFWITKLVLSFHEHFWDFSMFSPHNKISFHAFLTSHNFLISFSIRMAFHSSLSSPFSVVM